MEGGRRVARFISFEGGEGAGKTTQIRLLEATLRAAGLDVGTTREPGGPPSAEAIRRLLLADGVGQWDPLAETMLHTAARRQHVVERIRPWLDSGKWVVSDRFADSTVAYQGHAQGLGAKRVHCLNSLALDGLVPDLTLILDVPVRTGLDRARHRDGEEGANRYERMPAEAHERLRQAFLAIAAAEPLRCVVIDADRPADAVHATVVDTIETRLEIKL